MNRKEKEMYFCTDYGACSKSFYHYFSLRRHQVDKHGLPDRPGVCSICGKSFKSSVAILSHEENCKYRQSAFRTVKCSGCGRYFGTETAATQHEIAKGHDLLNHNLLLKASTASMLTEYYHKDVVLERDDRKESKKEAQDLIQKLLLRVQEESIGDSIYNVHVRNAGSVSTGTKVHLADEFDFDMPLDIKDEEFTVQKVKLISVLLFLENPLIISPELRCCICYICYSTNYRLSCNHREKGGLSPSNTKDIQGD